MLDDVKNDELKKAIKGRSDDLDSSIHKFKILFESFPIGITISNEEGEIILSNPEADRFLGIERDEQNKRIMDGKEWKIVRPDGTILPSEEYASIKATRENRKAENEAVGIFKYNNEIAWVNIIATPIPLEGFGSLSIYIDITQKILLDNKRKVSEERFTSLYHALSVGIIVYRNDGSISEINTTAREIFGIDSDRQVNVSDNSSIWKIIHEDGSDFSSEEHPAMRSIQSGKPEKGIIMGILAPNSKDAKWVIVNSEPIIDAKTGKIESAILSFSDISYQKKIQDELINYKEHLEELIQERTTKLLIAKENLELEINEYKRVEQDLLRNKFVLNSIFDGVITIDSDNLITSINKTAESLFQLNASDIIGKLYQEQKNLEPIGSDFKDVFEEKTLFINRTIYLQKSNKDPIPISMKILLLKENNTNKKEIVCTFRDLSQLEILQKEIKKQYSFHNIIAKDPKMQGIFAKLPEIAKSDCNVLIEGQTGTGKELIARAIVELSNRKNKPYIIINCGALPISIIESELFGFKKGSFTSANEDRTGKILAADGGTLFFDEIGELPLEVQSKLLRLLENYEVDRIGYEKQVKVDVRIISATNRNLHDLVRQKLFREDLYFRLMTVKLQIPSLSERKVDIPYLIEHFIKKLNAKQNKNIITISDDAMRTLYKYDFPGNIRELERILECSMIMCKGQIIELPDLPEEVVNSTHNEIEFSKNSNNSESESIMTLLKEIKDNFVNRPNDTQYREYEKDRLTSIVKEIISSGAYELKSSLKNLSSSEEKDKIILTLEKYNGNKTKTASVLGIHYTTLLYKMKKFDID
jgi:PAS domain S-box-containing protein